MEKKKAYVKPSMESETFVPNVYCKTCSDTEGGVKYYFKCDAGGGRSGGLYDKNWNLISNSWNSYSACNRTHESSTEDEYILGYFDPDRNHYYGIELIVYIWIERSWSIFGWRTNRHATTNLNKDSWEKNHS